MPSITRTFIAIPQTVREWTRFFESLLFSNTCTLTLTGVSDVAATTEVRYSVSAGVAALAIAGVSGTSNSTSATLETLPSQLRPKTAKSAIAMVRDNSSFEIGTVSIATTGIITLQRLNGAAFTSSGFKGISGSVVYQLD